jgi:hypothetical protein
MNIDENPFNSYRNDWLSGVQSYKYRFERHEGSGSVNVFEAFGDSREHTLLVEFDKDGLEIRRVMANPHYIAIISKTSGGDGIWKLDELRQHQYQSNSENKWKQTRGIDPFFVATTLFFLNRADEVTRLKQTSFHSDHLVWVQDPDDSGLDENSHSERIIKFEAVVSDGDVGRASLSTSKMLDQTIYSKTTTVEFENWETIDGVRIPLSAKYFIEPSPDPYLHYKVNAVSDITLNSSFDVNACYLRYYNLPDPIESSSRSGWIDWWSLTLLILGLFLIIVPIVLIRRNRNRD